ncbi:MAG: AbrB/MazE/SpoVT family DNA-binding domain-containing protein [Candidatus Aenigmarchaeota archaeon]|nr:AbrB/MazE/SpoVT family DNA-binding domain-containing protein [Candidatus Aenigmarchaeota archaeon]
METVKIRARAWGNSVGLVIPREIAEKEGIKPGKEVEILITKKTNVLKETFGTMKFKKSAQEMKDELRKELYD